MAPASKKKGTAKGAKNVALDVSNTSEAAKASCEFCQQSDIQGQNEVEKAGRMFKFMGKFYHYFCILFSFGVKQTDEGTGLRGFTLAEIQKVLKTGQSQKCAHCSKKGATAKCGKCKKKYYHFTCGAKNDAMFVYHGSMGTFCKTHRVKQTIKAKVEEKVCVAGCFEKIKDGDSKVMISPCCFRRYHLSCVQLQALSAGSHHFKCCMCSDKETFSKVAAELGTYIPVQDATWEQEEGFYGFQEQGQLYNTCDAPKCLCPKGRKHTLNGTYFELIRCEQCGSSAVHIKCAGLLKKAPFYVCKDHENAKEQMDRHKADIKKNPDYSSEESETEAEPSQQQATTPSPRKRANPAEATKSSSKSKAGSGGKKKLAPRKNSKARKSLLKKKEAIPDLVCLSSSSDDDETLWETRSFLNSKEDKMRETATPGSPIRMTAEDLAADLWTCLAAAASDEKPKRPHGQRARLFTLLHPEKPRLRIPLQPPPQPSSIHCDQPELQHQPPDKDKQAQKLDNKPKSHHPATKKQPARTSPEILDVIDEVCPAKPVTSRPVCPPAQVRPSLPAHLQPVPAQFNPGPAQFTPGPATLLTFTRPLLPPQQAQLPGSNQQGQNTVIPSLVKTWDASVVHTSNQPNVTQRRNSLYGEMVPTFGMVPQVGPQVVQAVQSVQALQQAVQTVQPTTNEFPTIGAAFSLAPDIPTVVQVQPQSGPPPRQDQLVIGHDSDGAPIYHQPEEVQEESQQGAPAEEEKEVECMFVMDGIAAIDTDEPAVPEQAQADEDDIIVLD